MKYWSRMVLLIMWGMIVGIASEMIGDSPETDVYTIWTMIHAVLNLSVIMIVAFLAGIEHEKNK